MKNDKEEEEEEEYSFQSEGNLKKEDDESDGCDEDGDVIR